MSLAQVSSVDGAKVAATHGNCGVARVVSAEPILLVKKDDSMEARLLYEPTEITGLQNLAWEFEPNRIRLSWYGRHLRIEDDVPHLKLEDLYPTQRSERTVEWHEDKIRYLHFSEGGYFHGLQLWLDYTTTAPERLQYGESGTGSLSRTANKLKEGTLRIALLGDSISQGANASGISGVPPFSAPYFELFLERLRLTTGAEVESKNFSVGGKTSEWGAREAESVAAWRPDLLVVAFGMNDASEGCSGDRFRENLQRIRQTIRCENPKVEFVWLSGMTPHPSWHLYRRSLREEYHEILRKMADEGASFCDVMTGWEDVVSRKGFLSVTGNGVNHPNDFGHRLYRDCLLHCVERAAGGTPKRLSQVGFG